MAVSKRLRFEVLRRDGHRCRYCGGCAPDVKLTVDHVVPETLGGATVPENLVAACESCNSGKASVPVEATLVADVAEGQLRWRWAMAQVAQQRRADQGLIEQTLDAFNAAWEWWTYTATGEKVPRPPDWERSVEALVAAGLSSDAFVPLVRAAMTAPRVKDEFRYFCGCAWREVSRRQELAAELFKASV